MNLKKHTNLLAEEIVTLVDHSTIISKKEKKMRLDKYKQDIDFLTKEISELVNGRKQEIAQTLQADIVQVYWEIGKRIIEKETVKGIQNQESINTMILELSKELTLHLGRGYSRSNLTYMRLFYLKYTDGLKRSKHLSWSHYIELLKVDNDLERAFYERQCIIEKWSVRELRRQRNSALFQRLALSRDKEGVLKLAKEGLQIERSKDLIKDPYVLEFLDIPESISYTERQFEQKLIDKLQAFLLELGKGFAFIGNQYRLTLNNNHFYVDLVFYHRILKCFVLIDLKIGEAKHQDIGQMNMYLNYFQEEENMQDDNAPIGIILAAAKDEVMIKYAMGGLSNQLFVSKYQTYLPDKALLEERLRGMMEESGDEEE